MKLRRLLIQHIKTKTCSFVYKDVGHILKNWFQKTGNSDKYLSAIISKHETITDEEKKQLGFYTVELAYMRRSPQTTRRYIKFGQRWALMR